jgi:hypothetical protein
MLRSPHDNPGCRDVFTREPDGLRVVRSAASPIPALKMAPDYSKGREVQEAEHFFIDLARNYAYVKLGGL